MRRIQPRGFFADGSSPRSRVIARSFASHSSRPAAGAPRLAASFALGAALGATAAYAYARRTLSEANRIASGDDASASERAENTETVEHEAMRHGWPLDTSSVIHQKSSYVHAFDGRTRNPRWVMEVITRETVGGSGSRKRSDFAEDEAVSWKHRSRLADYRGSGYDRGHLVAAADQKGSQEDMDATFALSNVSPQVGEGFNRDYWAKLEQFVRDEACADGTKAAYVATGPLFLASRSESADAESFDASARAVDHANVGAPRPTVWEMRHPMLGEPPALMAVPTHFFKVVFVEGEDSRVSCAAFVLPNSSIPKNVPLRRFVVPLTDLEIVSGLEFFRRGLAGEDRRRYERAEQTFLTTTAKQLPGSGKLPSLPPSKSGVSAPFNPLGDQSELVKESGKKWNDVRHLCDITACELKPSKWDKK